MPKPRQARVPLKEVSALWAAMRKRGHACGCQCGTIDDARAKSLGTQPRFGCKDLRRLLLRSARWREVYLDVSANVRAIPATTPSASAPPDQLSTVVKP